MNPRGVRAAGNLGVVPPHADAQIAQLASLELIHPPVDVYVSLLPRLFYHLALQDVRNLLSHVRLD